MTYGNIYGLINFLKEKKIELSKGMLEKVLESQLELKYFEILKEPEEIIELFLYPFPTDNKYDFIMKMKSKISFEQLESLVKTFNWNLKSDCYEELWEACKNPNIVADEDALRLIASQDNWLKMREIQCVCRDPKIMEDKETLRLIASQDNWQKMCKIRWACMNPKIFADKEALHLIASQDTAEKMEQLFFACKNLNVLKNKEILNLIAKQDTADKMEQLRLACHLSNKEALYLIAKQDTAEKMYEVRLACEDEEIFANCEVLQLIANESTWQRMRQIRYLYYQKKDLALVKRTNELLENVLENSGEVNLKFLNQETVKDLEYTRVLKRTDEEKK